MHWALLEVSEQNIPRRKSFRKSSLGSQYKRHILVVMPLFRRAKILPQIDTIIECTDKLLHNWRNQNDGQIHTDIVDQCQKLLLNIFSLIAFDYDLHTLDDTTDQTSSQLKTALVDILMAFRILIYSPRFFINISVFVIDVRGNF